MAPLCGGRGGLATRAVGEGGGRHTGELDFYAYGEPKAAAIRSIAERAGLDLAGSYAYSDSITDLPMLEAVGNPVAVNPDKDLRREAEEAARPLSESACPMVKHG